MAYYIRKGLVEENAEFLERVHRAIRSGNGISIPCEQPHHIARTRNWVNKMLRACDMLPDECGGRYQGLRAVTTVSDDYKGMTIQLSPKIKSPAPQQVVEVALKPTELTILRSLYQTQQDRIPLIFTPSESYPGDEWMITECAKRGFELSIVEFGEDDGPLAGTKSYVAVRIMREKAAPGGAFGFLDRYSKPGTPRS